MNKRSNSIVSVPLVLLLVSCTAYSQITGIAGAGKNPANNASPQPWLLLNREPFQYLEMKMQVVEILPGGMNVLATSNEPDLGPARVEGLRAKAAGSNSLIGLWVDQDPIWIRTNLLQLNKDGIVLDVTVTNSAGSLLASQKLAMRNYEEAIVELAAAANGRRLAVRLLPTVKELAALQDYPSLLPQFGASRGLLIRNSKEVVSRAGVVGKVDELNGTKQQFISVDSSRSGQLILSYRPFPGAVVAGYSIDRELRFEWNGDHYEWISLDKPFLPEGRWAIYAWQAGPSSNESVGFGGFETNANDLPDYLRQLAEQKKHTLGGVKK